MGYFQFKKLEASGYNAKLFYIDNGVEDLPPITDQTSIARGSEAYCPATGETWILDSFFQWKKKANNSGTAGEDGATFTPIPIVEDETLTLRWKNDKDLPNPTPVGITAPQGEPGVPGTNATINGRETIELVAGSNIELLAVEDQLVISSTGGGGGGGENGATFIPLPEVEGNTLTLSWENNKSLPNPAPVAVSAPQGEKGDKGDQGVKGDQGEQGLKGDKGDSGSQGIQGEKGEKGDQGEQGIQGIQGVQGLQGLQGDPGTKGDPGEQGLAGEKGDKGDKGEKGDKGDDGESFSIYKTYESIELMNADFANVPEGQFVMIAGSAIAEDNGKIFVRGPVQFDYVSTMSGLKGDKGDPGEQGIPGEKGEKGDKGDTGDKGDPGLKGEQGIQGIQGEQGLKGDQGIQGEKGDPGIAGFTPTVEVKTSTETDYVLTITNESGSLDTPNLKGSQGTSGDKGDQGEDGFSPTVVPNTDPDTGAVTLAITDINGTVNTPDLKGPKGSDGAEGTAGTDGISPTITIKTQSDTEYILTITDAEGPIDTPNLKGAKGDKGDKGDDATYTLPVATETILGGITAKIKTTEENQVAIDESGKLWYAASETPAAIGFNQVISNDSLTEGKITITHGLKTKAIITSVFDQEGFLVIPKEIKIIDINSIEVDLNDFTPLTGDFTLVVLSNSTEAAPTPAGTVVTIDGVEQTTWNADVKQDIPLSLTAGVILITDWTDAGDGTFSYLYVPDPAISTLEEYSPEVYFNQTTVLAVNYPVAIQTTAEGIKFTIKTSQENILEMGYDKILLWR